MDDLEASRRKISEAESKIHRLAESKLKEEMRLDNFRNAQELKCNQINAESQIHIKDIESKIRQLESQRQQEQMLLDRSKGSLCEWLDNNVEGWEKTIGKIVDEKYVLYSQNLSHTLTDN